MFTSDCHMLATTTSEISFDITSAILLQSSSVDCLNFSAECSNLHQLSTMEDMNEQCMSSCAFEQSKEQLVKTESESDHLIDSVLKIQTSTVDEWINSPLEALFHINDEMQDFNPLVMNPYEGSSIQVNEDISRPFVTATVSCDTHIQPGVLDHQILPLPLNLQTEDRIVVGTSSLPGGVVCGAARRDMPKQATKRFAVKGAAKRRLLSESQDDSDGDSQSGDNDSPSQKRLALFAREFSENGRRCKPYFWQYNIQSRGPKGQRLCTKIEIEDSHVVPDFSDPVFGDSCQLSQWRHNGRARQGDGNDPHPDPLKLLTIGCHIWCLESKFQGLCGESFGDEVARCWANRQKNKLASRICRLKKKALHAANKIKLDGLKQEHDQLMQVITSLVAEMELFITTESARSVPLCHKLDLLIKNHLTFMVAGNTADFVNAELGKVAQTIISQEQ